MMSNIIFSSLSIYTVIPFLIFLICLYRFFISNHFTAKRLPPSPTNLPIIGNLHQIGKLAHRSLHELSQQHGKLMLLHFGKQPVLVVSSAEFACEILKTQDVIFADRPQLSIFKRLFFNCSNVAAAPYGDYWKRVRSICVLQLLSSKRVQSFRSVREEELAEMVQEIRKASTAVNLSKLFVNFTSDMICRVAFGMKFHGEKDGINFKELMEKHEELVGSFYVGEFIPWLGWINHLNGVEAAIRKVAKDMNECLEVIIQEHIDRRSEDSSRDQGNDSGKPKDLVDVLLEMQDDQTANLRLHMDSLKAIILDMFVAGTTTTFATLEWAMSELLRNPRVMESLKTEVRGIARGKSSLTEDDLEEMKYLKAVIKETFRLHPAVPILIPRISMQDTKINGYDISARTQVSINVWAIHRDPASWNEPEEFYPERFLNSTKDFRGQNFDLIPFGSGRRICPGILFAIANLELVLANLINKFDWSLPEGTEGRTLDMTEYPGLTTHRVSPLLAVATPHRG